MTGTQFLTGMMRPIAPASIFSMVQSGFPADFLIGLCVSSIGGYRNDVADSSLTTGAEERFLRVIDLMRAVQRSGGLAIRILRDPVSGDSVLLVLRRTAIDDATMAKTQELRELLGLDPDVHEFRLVFSPVAGESDEVVLTTRSMLQIMLALSRFVDVPEQHLAEGRATIGFGIDDTVRHGARLRVRCAPTRPDDAFATVRYRGHWFYIEDTDLESKQAFSFMLFLFTLADTSAGAQTPILTIPTG